MLTLVLMNTYPVLVSQRFIYQTKQSGMATRALLIASTLAGLDKLTSEAVGNIMYQLDDQGLSRLMVADEKCAVVFDTSLTDNAVGRYALLPELYGALSGNDVFYSGFSQGAFQSRTAVPIVSRGRIIGAVFLYEYDTEQGSLLLRFQYDIANMTVVIAVAALLISVVVSSALTRRVSELLRAIRLVREGQYDHLIPVRGRDELAELANAFNRLTLRIQETDSLRRQFVSDASHELKTPLSSMRLLADSILLNEDMPLPHVREFVEDIGGEIDRLTRMTEKLMLLTKLDSKVAGAEPKRVPLEPVISRARRMLEPLAAQAQVTIRCELDPLCEILANDDDIYQVFFNLMENAIKYNREGGTVTVYMYGGQNSVISHIDDTGMGIPDIDMPRLFERFYRVDKTRAREAGGSGLGLSIVNDMVARYGGEINIQSELDNGTRFTVEFPAYNGGAE